MTQNATQNAQMPHFAQGFQNLGYSTVYIGSVETAIVINLQGLHQWQEWGKISIDSKTEYSVDLLTILVPLTFVAYFVIKMSILP